VKKTIVILIKILKWFNCWQSYFSLFIISLISSLNSNFLFILLENEYGEYPFNDKIYVFFGYLLILFLGAIHYSKTRNGFTEGEEYINFVQLVKLKKVSTYHKILMIFVVIPLMGFFYKWIYLLFFMIFILLPLRVLGFDVSSFL